MSRTVIATIAIMSMIITVPCSAAAADKNAPVITFLVGKVQMKLSAGKEFMPAVANVPLGRDCVIMTGDSSFAEIGIGANRYTINQNKTVRIADLRGKKADDAPETPSKRLFTRMLAKQRTQVIAVRGAENEEQVEWITEGGKDSSGDALLMKEMTGLFTTGDYENVVRVYARGAADIKGDRAPFEYIAALAHFSLCRYGDALSLFEKVAKTAKDASLKSDSLFYAGFSSHNMLDYAKSNGFLGAYITKYPSGTFMPQARYLRGCSLIGLKSPAKARDDFRMVMENYPDDPVAKDAENEFARLKQQ